MNDGTNDYIYGSGVTPLMAVDGSSNETFYMSDGLGSTTDLIDASQTVTDTYSYDAFLAHAALLAYSLNEATAMACGHKRKLDRSAGLRSAEVGVTELLVGGIRRVEDFYSGFGVYKRNCVQGL